MLFFGHQNIFSKNFVAIYLYNTTICLKVSQKELGPQTAKLALLLMKIFVGVFTIVMFVLVAAGHVSYITVRQAVVLIVLIDLKKVINKRLVKLLRIRLVSDFFKYFNVLSQTL